ncbi:hypothetical protein ABIA23_004803 [Sinorhizobium fredii]
MSIRPRTQRALDHSSNLIIADRSGPARANFVEQAIEPVFKKAPSPFANRMFMHAEFARNDLARNSVGTAKNDPASLRHGTSNPMLTHLSL